MSISKRIVIAGLGALVLAAGLAIVGARLHAATVKVADPTSVVMIVNRDSNEIAFMDIKTKKIVGKTFLGNNVNPHMVMMSPDGRYVVTGHAREHGLHRRRADAAAGEEDSGGHRAGTPLVLA